MSIKAKAPKKDPETIARERLAEQRALAGRIEELSADVSEDTRSVVRRFGRINGTSLASLPGSGGSGGSGGSSGSAPGIGGSGNGRRSNPYSALQTLTNFF